MPDLAAGIGRAMLLTGAVLLLLGLLATLPRAVRAARRARALRTSLDSARLEVRTALALLRTRRAETDELLAPWRRLLRWARHPLVLATVDWYLRRRRSSARA